MFNFLLNPFRSIICRNQINKKNLSDEKIYVYAKFYFKPGEIDNFMNILKGPEGLKKTREFKGCLDINCFIDIDNEDCLVLYQQWESKEDHQSYLNWRKESGMMDELNINLLEPLIPIYLEYVSDI